MRVSECMTRDVQVVNPDEPISKAAQFMLEADAGSMPVGDGDRLVGMITDRDIAVRAVARGRGPDTAVRDVMTDELLYVFEDQSIDEVAANMGDSQVRRFPVVNREKRLVGIVSLGDICRSEEEAATRALEGVSEPGGKHDQSMEQR
jgi:CBS domain-containing protein